jgi:hypothetical protein
VESFLVFRSDSTGNYDHVVGPALSTAGGDELGIVTQSGSLPGNPSDFLMLKICL